MQTVRVIPAISLQTKSDALAQKFFNIVISSESTIGPELHLKLQFKKCIYELNYSNTQHSLFYRVTL